ncbi:MULTISPECIES: HepT-like ribonuclease domain-containing protein [unclassified Pseudonocardia]|uniref:HepT-like ribonuclease domain-containing protein n=1 Tax=unclassified Pseudonocardia TaxID=2619320 RepID=UPI00192BCCF2|nr:HepT-like ribonuclease domain-containing protein [Pseudonocardia sp. Ae707_Ps1]
MIDAVEQIQQLGTDITLDEITERRERRDALLWNYTVLGEAVGQVSTETKARFPAVAWHQPVRLRNRIVHGYWSIDMEILLTTARRQLPALATELRDALAVLSADE